MKHVTWKHLTAAIAAVAISSIALLWSWNTLADLLGGPTAEFRHVVAALVVAAAARVLISPRRRHRRHAH